MGNLDGAGGRPQRRGLAVYLDHAATTPMLPEALAAMTEELAQIGNPSSLHNAGRRARRVVEESREQIAAGLWRAAQRGGLHQRRHRGRQPRGQGPVLGAPGTPIRPRRRVLATAIEHHAVLDCVQWLGEHEDAEVDWLPVDSAGRLSARTPACRDRARP